MTNPKLAMRIRILADEELSDEEFQRQAYRIALEAHEDRLKLWESLHPKSAVEPSSERTVDVELCPSCTTNVALAQAKARELAQKPAPDYRVQCKCGWMGRTQELNLPTHVYPYHRCPKCNAEFKQAMWSQCGGG